VTTDPILFFQKIGVLGFIIKESVCAQINLGSTENGNTQKFKGKKKEESNKRQQSSNSEYLKLSFF
jgi:hypothetical protein